TGQELPDEELTRTFAAPTTDVLVESGIRASIDYLEIDEVASLGDRSVIFVQYFYVLQHRSDSSRFSITGAPNIYNNSVTNVSVSGKGARGANVSLTLTDKDEQPITAPTVTVQSDGTWSVSGIDASSLANGPITYTAVETDAIGTNLPESSDARKSLLAFL